MVAIEPDRSTRSVGRRGGGQGEFNFPTVVATTREALWVGDTLNFRLQRFALEGGGFLGAFGRLGDAPGEMPRLKGLAVDPGGNLWLSDAHLDQVALFRPDGAFLMALPGNGSPDGGFSFPAGIATHPDGRVAIVDSLNRRLQILRLVDTPKNGGAT